MIKISIKFAPWVVGFLWICCGNAWADPTLPEAAQDTASREVLADLEGAVGPVPIRRLTKIEETPPRFEVVINIPATQLTLYDQGRPVKNYKISVGTPRWPTPEGRFEIYEIQWNPWWIPPESDWAKEAKKTPPGPANPLYPVKLMMANALRIHGTPSAWSIGRAASHGCMRMRRKEVRELAEFLEANLREDHDPADFEKYRKTPWQPYRTVLPKDNRIWVYMIYQPMERWSNQLVLHPNYYGRRIAYEDHLLNLLADAGVYTAPVDFDKFKEVRKKIRKTTQIPFLDILYEESPPENLPDPFLSACLVEEDPTLAQMHERFNTRLEYREYSPTTVSQN